MTAVGSNRRSVSHTVIPRGTPRLLTGCLPPRHPLPDPSPCSGTPGGGADDDSEPLSKRHSDGIFTDSYSRYRIVTLLWRSRGLFRGSDFEAKKKMVFR